MVLLMFVVLLMLLPFATSLNEALTRAVEKMFWYEWMQRHIVPYEARVLSGLLDLIPGVVAYANIKGVEVDGMQIYVTWNCIGWQSFLLLLVSIAAGFGRRFTLPSQIYSLTFGVAGLFLLNVFRMLLTVLLAVYSPRIFIILFHNYLSVFMTIAWLLFFWWFSYTYVLVPRGSKID